MDAATRLDTVTNIASGMGLKGVIRQVQKKARK
jgi:hypothetical protein